MNISYSKNFVKKFAKYPKDLQIKFHTAISKIPDGDIKKVIGKNIPPIYRLRVSKYRILFHMNTKKIEILKIDSRGDIYK